MNNNVLKSVRQFYTHKHVLNNMEVVKIDHILGHEEGLNKFPWINIIQSMFSDYQAIKLELDKMKGF